MLKIFLCKQENPRKKSFLTPFFLLLEVKKSVKPGQAVHRPEVIDKSKGHKGTFIIKDIKKQECILYLVKFSVKGYKPEV